MSPCCFKQGKETSGGSAIGALPLSGNRDRREAAAPSVVPSSPSLAAAPSFAFGPSGVSPTVALTRGLPTGTPTGNGNYGTSSPSPAAGSYVGPQQALQRRGYSTQAQQQRYHDTGDDYTSGESTAVDTGSGKPNAAGSLRSFSYALIIWRLRNCFQSVQQCCTIPFRSHKAHRPDRRSAATSGSLGAQEMRSITPLSAETASLYCDNMVVNSRYTLQNFIFKNLYEQFSRPLNFYFLLVAMLQFISVIAPVNPLSTLLPLLFAFTLTAVKEGYDDVKRHRQDFAYNNATRTVLDAAHGAWVPRRNADICVGDVLLLSEEEEIPCDVVVIGAPSSVYIRTDNLDGEIDLKPKERVQWTSVSAEQRIREVHVLCPMAAASADTPPSAAGVAAAVARLRLECPPPSAMVESFEGRADVTEAAAAGASSGGLVRVPLTHHHLLPQSCILKNVAQVVCVAVYTGDDTKCGMNKREPPVKWAQIDKDVSRYSIYIFICQMLNAVIFGFIGYRMNRNVHETVWYLPLPANEVGGSAVIYPLRFFLLTTVMIPVSFKFVVDVCKYYMANTVEWDVAMQHESGGTAARPPARRNSLQRMLGNPQPESGGCKVKNSSILEDLGQIDYVLSDKTGTLTQNVMELDSVTVMPGYHVPVAKLADGCVTVPREYVSGDASALSTLQRFAQMLALCNTVEVVRTAQDAEADEEASGGVTYHAASPDEIALCNGMRKLGVTLVLRNERRAVLRVYQGGEAATLRYAMPSGCFVDETWVVHHTFHFSSEKKSMGVLVEEPETARVWFVVKGADDRVLSMAASGAGQQTDSTALNAECASKLALYAHRGLRTLLLGRKEVSHEQLATFLRAIEEANCLTEGRQARLDALRDEMERDIEVLGITAIEDKLQVDVKETISDMLVAGIKVWMLTGDKMETAEQIGLACGLYHPEDRVISIGEPGGGTAQDWQRRLLDFNLDLLPATAHSSHASYRKAAQDALWRLAGMSKAAARACGKELESRVLRFNAGDAEQLSNTPLLSMQRGDDGSDGPADDAAAGYGSLVRGPRGASNAPVVEGDAVVRPAVLIVQGGPVLESILHDPALRERFAALSSRCRSVICARTTPSQKAAITQFVRQRGYMTLSVGDGGNDVAMLQEAHVGVGIAGKEGQQASRAADFSITQFSDLRTLLFVHGQQAYVRTAYVIKYSFYKSMLISFIQLAYNVIGTHASGNTFWNSFSLTMWNGFYTLPQTIFYCFDRCAPRVVLERNPYLYKLTRHAVDIHPVEFFVSFVLRGVLQSVGLLWLSTRLYGWRFAYAEDGGTASNDVTFSVAYTALMLSQIFTVWWESHSLTPLNVLALVGMPAFYIYSTLVYSDRPALQYYGVFRRSLDNVGILASLAVAAALVVPGLIFFTLLAVRHPNSRDTLRRAELKRQRFFLGGKDHRHAQSMWVRWFHATPEAPSMLCARATTLLGGDTNTRDDLI